MLTKLVSRVTVTVAIASLLGAAAWGQDQPQKSPWKDRAEYDLYTSIAKEADPAKKLQLLNSYKEKYPETQFEEQILKFYLQTYGALKQTDNVYGTALDLLKLDPKSMDGLYSITRLTLELADTSPDRLTNGEKYAAALLDSLKAMQKPVSLSQADWDKERTALEVTAHTALGWVAMSRKSNAAAEGGFRQALELNPTNGQVSYWLGTVIIAQRDPAKQSEAFFHFARAANYTGAGAMAPAGRKTVGEYLNKIYNSFHGDDESGMAELVAMAQKSAFPPAGLKIKSKEQVKYENAERLKKENPTLALWLTIKEQLTGAGGSQYFASAMKGTRVAGLRGYLISATPAERPKTLVLAMSGRGGSREVTLVLNAPFRYSAPRGTTLRFEGMPTSFSRQPFMVTFDVLKDNVKGWPAPPQKRTTTK